MHLFCELLFTEFVQGVEFPGQRDVVKETDRGKFDTDDNLSVRDHHGHSTEVDLQIFWQLLTTSITRILENKSVIK